MLFEKLWGKLFLLNFHMTLLSLVLNLAWRVDNWIQSNIDSTKWYEVDQSSKTFFTISTTLPATYCLLMIDLEILGVMSVQSKINWQKWMTILSLLFAVTLFAASVGVFQNASALNDPPLYCDKRVKCTHLTCVGVCGIVSAFGLLLASFTHLKEARNNRTTYQ
ncbi:uncharacterized protein LOC130634565 [Hydractinia symbiolongicarpus]|uniref:uncharacterized protein LOC130634565 n=1 Tax=Hydractinia symbiolongicarpus TaxID=13093 RepID=UPI00254FBA75|nr:uncharacterized protein LOC130634565 [Hydractinia symbiolongicarpus]